MSKKEPGINTGISDSGEVDAFVTASKYPMIDVVQYLRKAIFNADKNIGERIFYNAPTFFYTGKMKPFHPKDYKRYIAGFVLNKKDLARLVFLRGTDVTMNNSILEGDYKDGRRLAVFVSIEDAKSKEKELKKIIAEITKLIKSEQ